MHIEQIYTGCLAQGAYYIESKGEVAIIDPLREVQPYIDKANDNNAVIKYIFETHFHADFVSGHVTLSKRTGAPIIFGPNANPSYDAIIAEDGQQFVIGDITITALHTPGHTMESTTYLLINSEGKNHAIFSGDTLFLGDVGRPDLAQKAANMSQEDLAGILFDSLRSKIMTLEDDVLVYPAHGAGSACGKKMSKETIDTLGNQKKTNYALRENMSKEEFIIEVTSGLQPPPKYFPVNVQMNKDGYEDIQNVLDRGLTKLDPNQFEYIANQTDALILDVRNSVDFSDGHIPSSIFIGLDGNFAPWVGALVADTEQPILVVAPEGREKEAITRLSRVGFDNTLGYLGGSFDSWKRAGKNYDTLDTLSPSTLEEIIMNRSDIKIYDVRNSGEYQSEHVIGALNTPLDSINDHLEHFLDSDISYLYCAGGYRSVIAASILKSRGIHNLINITGGFKAIKNTTIDVSNHACSTSK